MLDERWIKALHVESMRRADLHAEREPHVLFQASTIGALLEGAYDGDLSFAELAEHGDLGLGTLNRLDGEMIALDGEFFRADVDGAIHPVPPEARTPFAVVTRFEAEIDERIEGALSHEELLARLDDLADSNAVVPGMREQLRSESAASCAIRLDGRFELVRARSVPAQSPPYRPLTEVVAEQHVFELEDVEGTMLGFRFPAYAEGIEVGGYHLHFIDAERRRGGHVLDSRTNGLRARLDPSNDLHVELPPRVDLVDPDLAASTHEAIVRAENG
ncbi:MAG TPA: acetolactate decarboxylase [Solirubrobacterales bacterium]|nr:acetolactate decarboxylase [Solirubrobacterales bacterium]